MPEAWFYVLPERSAADARYTCCTVASRWRKEGRSLCVYTRDRERAEAMDDLLWTFRDVSFLPHGLADQADAEETGLVVAWADRLPGHRDTLINLSDDVPGCAGEFARLVEIVPPAGDERERARARYRIYRERGYPLHRCELKQSHGLRRGARG